MGPFQPAQREGSDTGTSLHQGNGKYAGDNYEDDGDSDEDDDEDNNNLRLIYGTNRESQMNPPIVPYELVPDYVWLASARIVVEANLWEAFELSEDPNALSMGDVLPLLRKMHTTRLGGSPGYWNGGAIRWSLVSCTQFFALCYALHYTNAKSDSKVSCSGRRRRCRLGGQARRWGCWDCGLVHCMRGRIRLVSAAVLLCLGLLVDTVWT